MLRESLGTTKSGQSLRSTPYGSANRKQQHQPLQNKRPHNPNRLHPNSTPGTNRLRRTAHQPRPKLHSLPSPLAPRHQERPSHKRKLRSTTHSTNRQRRSRAMAVSSSANRKMDNAYARPRHRPLRTTTRKLLPGQPAFCSSHSGQICQMGERRTPCCSS